MKVRYIVADFAGANVVGGVTGIRIEPDPSEQPTCLPVDVIQQYMEQIGKHGFMDTGKSVFYPAGAFRRIRLVEEGD